MFLNKYPGVAENLNITYVIYSFWIMRNILGLSKIMHQHACSDSKY
jgi:hypothetical protein